MAQQQKVVSQFPYPPRRYYHNCATDRPTPPPPPPQGTAAAYRMFGAEYTTQDAPPSLEDAGRRRLYDASKPATEELGRLNAQLLDLFMRLVQSLCRAPVEQGADDTLVSHIEDVFVNMQYLINLMRPTQAAMDLKMLLDRQTESRKQMTLKLRESVTKSWDLVSEAAGALSRPVVQLPPSLASFETTGVGAAAADGDAGQYGNTKAQFENNKEDIDKTCDFLPTARLITPDILAQLAQLASNPSL